MSLDAIVFDLGNVLVFHDNQKLFTRMAEVFDTTPAAMKARLDGGLWERVNRGQLPGDALRVELVERLGKTIGPEQWFEVWNCHFTLNEPMVRAVEELVTRLPLVLLSNTHDAHLAFLRPKLPVLERFKGLVLSYEQGLIKPERGIYQAALDLAGTAPDRTVFFDDVQTYAVSAEQVGMRGRVFTTVEQLRLDLLALGYRL